MAAHEKSPSSSAVSNDDDIDIEHSLEPVRTQSIVPPDGLLAKTISLVRTKDSLDPGPPPDGGFHAWLQAGLVHLVIFNTWGYVNGFGVFQTYYVELLDRAPSDISWIGSVQIFLLFFIGTFSGRATDAGFFRITWAAGALLCVLGIFTASCSTAYWQLFLSQGLCLGVGSGLMFCPSIALTATYFSRNRGLALAIAATGSAVGGMVFPVTVQQLLPRIGFAWTMRVLGLITTVTLAPGLIFLRPRLPPRRAGPVFELAAFREPAYALFATGMFLSFWALYVAFFYVGSFARTVIGVSQTTSINLILIMNAAGTIGRLIPNLISDRLCGPINALVPVTFIVAILFYGWIGVRSLNALYAFAVLYGFFGAGVQSLFPAASTSLTTDLKKTGVRFGMILSIVSFASLTGSPIAGALIDRGGGEYVFAQIFGAVSMTVAGVVLAAARYMASGPKLMVRV